MGKQEAISVSIPWSLYNVLGEGRGKYMPGKVQNEELSKTKKLANVKKQNNNQKPPISKCIKNKYSLM